MQTDGNQDHHRINLLNQKIQSSMPWSIKHIKDYLPHREPFLLIDSASYLTIWGSAFSKYHIAKDNPIFKGHFPEMPVFPGVMIVESLAQTAALLLVVSKQTGKKIGSCFLCRIDSARFFNIVHAGCDLDNKVEFIKKRPPFYWCEGTSYVDGKKVASASLCAKLE